MSGTLPGRDQVGGDVPGWLTSFIGRQDELAQLRQLLDGESRLVTLSGLGGAGKSRMAAELARGFVTDRTEPRVDGLVGTADVISRSRSVPAAVAGALRLALSAAPPLMICW